MGVLSNLEPKKVFEYFEQICNIPHGSGNIQKISDYLVDFAKERNLEYYQDEMKNVIIIKEATKGYENSEPVMIQGHMDMVAVTKDGLEIDMKNHSLDLDIEGDYVYAKNTSLGGDDGIAVAYALAMLDSSDISHPRLEVVITVDEEIGLLGAKGIDLSMCKAKRMINIDSEEEGFLLASCAGGASFEASLPVKREQYNGVQYRVSIDGMLGGHSGVEIDKERGNACVLMARILERISKEVVISIVTIRGGHRDNVIPNEAEAVFVADESKQDVIKNEFAKVVLEIKNELKVKDPGFNVDLTEEGIVTKKCILNEDSKKLLEMILTLPCGICGNSASIKGLVETSLNLGMLTCGEEKVSLIYAVRSSVESQKYFLLDKLRMISKNFGAVHCTKGDYPGWEYKVDSSLRDIMTKIYEDMYGEKMVIQAVHAGLECGFFSQKIEGLDCVSLGPDMKDIHSVREKLSISSTKRVWEYLVKVLASLK